MNRKPAATALLLTAALAGCSNGDAPEAPPAATSRQVVAPPAVAAAKYTDPRDMRARSGMSFTDCSEGTTRNVNNAVSQLCNLPNGETVGFYTFETETAGQATSASLKQQGRMFYMDSGWIVSAGTRDTIDKLVAALR